MHSRYYRRLTDLPVVGKSFVWQLKVHKFFCDNDACDQRIFTERFSQHIQPYARWLTNCQGQLKQLGLLAGGQYGSQIGRLFGLFVSGSTLLRRARACPFPIATTPRVLGVDDWAFKKRERYGTILVDLEKRQVIDLLPDRETDTLKSWLNEHPGVEIISRDRASTYALAAAQAAPQAVQVADRWHLLKNLGDAIQRVLETNRPAMKQAAGQSIRWVAGQLGLSRNTVRKYWRWTTYQPKTIRRWSPVLRYEEYLRRRWAEGQRHVKSLHQELVAQGYKGSFRTLYRVVSRFLRDPEPAQPTVRRIDYSPRQVSIWLSRPTEELPSQPVKDYIATLLNVCPSLRLVRDLSLSFKQLMASKQAEKLDEWLARCESTGLDALRQFVRGLRQDYAAVREAFSSGWSNGQVEGQVNRLKTIKRAMYGRAGFELLRIRVVMTSG
ncbi:ISL3 family transposase [Spirosoma sp. SC4-14]|uniref:ISL3 family transposase n=1 Tax=Spirosoma sp. SC4-14 TaxID=3128900 RepID=UPI0030CFD299